MKPSKEEIESAIGGKLPENAELEFGGADPKSSGDTKFDFVVMIKDKFSVWKKSVLGRIVGFYIVLGSIFPLPTLSEVTFIAADHFVDFGHLVYQRVIDPSPRPPDTYIVTVPTEFPLPPSGSPLSQGSLPTGSGIHPLSSYDLQGGRRALG